MVRHHPTDETLMSFAAGTLGDAFVLVLNSHLQFCAECREKLALMEKIGGTLIGGMDASLDEAFESRTMARFAKEAALTPPSPVWHAPDCGDERLMPAPLAIVTGLSRDTVPWQGVSEGLYSHSIELSDNRSILHLLRLDPGLALDKEVHYGEHLILVLWGGYETEDGRFVRGDLHEIGAGVEHSFKAMAQEGVVCVIATAAEAKGDHAWAVGVS